MKQIMKRDLRNHPMPRLNWKSITTSFPDSTKQSSKYRPDIGRAMSPTTSEIMSGRCRPNTCLHACSMSFRHLSTDAPRVVTPHTNDTIVAFGLQPPLSTFPVPSLPPMFPTGAAYDCMSRLVIYDDVVHVNLVQSYFTQYFTRCKNI